MSGNAHPNPVPIFPCSVCAGYLTCRGKSVQCCTCSKWVHLRCSQLSFSEFRTFGSSHSWSSPLLRSTRNIVTSSLDSSSLHTSTVQSGPLCHHCTLTRLQISYPPSAHFISSPSAPHHCFLLLAVLLRLLLPFLPDSLRVLQWNARDLRARSTELLHFLASHSFDLICIQESNLNSSFSSRILCSAFDRTHSRSGILSRDATHASGGVVIFVRQGLSCSELSTFSLSSLDPYSNYVGVNISLNNSTSLSFFNVYAPYAVTLLPHGTPLFSV